MIWRSSCTWRSDHPRSRGVYVTAGAQLGSVGGSSPLARGLQFCDALVNRIGRIIPARAGFTRRTHLFPSSAPDHPRSRGVYDHPRRPKRERGGSSPLARGLPILDSPRLVMRGIIPARAGFTIHGREAGDGQTDHPRSRGVYASTPRTRGIGPGSSPLARGLPAAVSRRPPIRGIIPARAGFTGVASGWE